MSTPVHPVSALAAETSLEIGVGHMLVNIGDPLPGSEEAYTRWYEDDHFFSAATMAPFVFAGRRWVAPAPLRALQYARPEGALSSGRGAYAATYWIAPGHLNDYLAWSLGTGPRLNAQGRGFTDRTLVFTCFADRLATVYRDAGVPRDVHALMDPAPGLVVQVIDAPDASTRTAAAEWLRETYLPERLADAATGARSALIFQGASDTSAMRPALHDLQLAADNHGRRLLLLWFLDAAPASVWEAGFADQPRLIDESGYGLVEWIAPFVPVHMGTNDYIDELRIERAPH